MTTWDVPYETQRRYLFDPQYHAEVHLVGRLVWFFGQFCRRYA